ncbi:MAG: glycosyltransferase family 2 protein [Acidobacteria bacterium]|nr:glycosyltransferase family 2 protein [Acidobacteriota bacterium]
MDVSIIVPTWNGLPLLRRFLPPLLEEAQRYRDGSRGAVEVIVVDDASRDGTPDFLKSLPVQVVARSLRGGFSRACNAGIGAAHFPFTILLNNDVLVAPGFAEALVRPFSDPVVFAVTARAFEPVAGLLATAGKIGTFRKGFWSVYFNYDRRVGPHPVAPGKFLSAYAVGGFCAFRTEAARQLGGFDEMYSPFHWEDIDFSYRAWKRGWEVVYQHDAVAWHQASSTIGAAFQRQDVEIVAVRNRLLFHWKNLHDPVMLCQHVAMLALLLLSRWAVADLAFYQAFWGALKKWPECRQSRLREKSAARRSDRQVRRLLHQFAARPDIEVFHSRQEVAQRYHERFRSPDHFQ